MKPEPEFPHLLAIAFTIAGSMVISMGMVLQKRGVGWFRHKELKNDHYKRLKRIWFIGFFLNNCLSIFYYFALKGLTASVVGAMMGLNIVFSAIFSSFILKEHISKTLAALSLLLVGFILLANLSAPAYEAAKIPDPTLIITFCGIPFVLVALAHLLRKTVGLRDERYAICFAAAAGALEGFIIVLIKALQASKGSNPLLYFTSPYLYLYLLASVSLIAFLQVAYSHGRMTRTAPVLWGAQILYPVVISYLAFSVKLVHMQLAAFGGIIVCVILIQAKRR